MCKLVEWSGQPTIIGKTTRYLNFLLHLDKRYDPILEFTMSPMVKIEFFYWMIVSAKDLQIDQQLDVDSIMIAISFLSAAEMTSSEDSVTTGLGSAQSTTGTIFRSFISKSDRKW